VVKSLLFPFYEVNIQLRRAQFVLRS